MCCSVLQLGHIAYDKGLGLEIDQEKAKHVSQCERKKEMKSDTRDKSEAFNNFPL